LFIVWIWEWVGACCVLTRERHCQPLARMRLEWDDGKDEGFLIYVQVDLLGSFLILTTASWVFVVVRGIDDELRLIFNFQD
jgi:hypothetical protein